MRASYERETKNEATGMVRQKALAGKHVSAFGGLEVAWAAGTSLRERTGGAGALDAKNDPRTMCRIGHETERGRSLPCGRSGPLNFLEQLLILERTTFNVQRTVAGT